LKPIRSGSTTANLLTRRYNNSLAKRLRSEYGASSQRKREYKFIKIFKKSLFALFLFFCTGANSFSQTVYELNLKRELILGTLSLGIGITPFFVNNEPENIPVNLDKNKVNGLDRSLMFSYKKPLDLITDNGACVLALLPIISVIPNIKEENTLLTYGVMYGQALLLTLGTTFTLKNAVIRYRPYMYADGIPEGKEKDYYNSFPSGAASFSFLGASFLSATFSHEFPDSKMKLPVIIGSYSSAAAIASLRIVSGAHFATDVLTSALIGSVYGWLIPTLHLKNNSEKLALIPIGNGVIFSVKI
jgi:membrane-associated phospholipid phosphatase